MRARESAIDQRIQSALDGERGRLQQDREQLAGDRQQTRACCRPAAASGWTFRQREARPICRWVLAWRKATARASAAPGRRRAAAPNGTLGGTDDAKPSAKNGSGGGLNFPTSFGPAQKTLSDTTDNVASTVADAGSRAVGASAKPVYTVPSNSTLMGSIAMTALIGRCRSTARSTTCIRSGADRLGQPDRQWHRHSRRGWCGGQRHGLGRLDALVRARANPLGDLRLQRRHGAHHAGGRQPQPERRQRVGQRREQHHARRPGLDQRSLWHPCVSGERRSNAQQYLGSQALITAAGAGAASLIKSNNGSVAVVANNNSSLGTVGISGNEAMGRILAGGVRDMADWVNKLYGQAFAAVYVRPGAKVAVHLEQPLNIDYDAKGGGSITASEASMRRIWIESAAALCAALVLGGCATSKDKITPARRSPCSTCGTRRRAAAPVAGRRRGNCSTRARACAGR